MFTTSSPGRVVGAKTVTIAAGKAEILGKEGLFGLLRPLSDGILLSAALSSDRTEGYEAENGTAISFSDTVAVYNAGKEAAKVSLLIFDTI